MFRDETGPCVLCGLGKITMIKTPGQFYETQDETGL